MGKLRRARQPLYVHGVFCESVRDEVQGSQTLVGVYRGQVVVDGFPGNFSQLSVSAWIRWPLGADAPARLRTVLVLPDGQEVPTDYQATPLPTAVPEDADSVEVAIVQVFANVPVTRHGRLQFFIDLDDRRYRAVALRIIEREAQAAEPPRPTTA
ncbi:MAG: hypothetical protein NT133_06900 [Alphaproteobacteria bacterium]|nr:hypothetical protein [Alphaproteobacteria bacterium]